MSKPKLLDLFCGAGGAGAGYALAGFEVVGVDINDQPNYPYEFHRCDAMEYVIDMGYKFDAIHASPPCQPYSKLAHLSNGKHAAIVPAVRAILQSIGRPYVIENVPGSPLRDPVTLCGSMFNLETSCGAQLRRHRLFETSFRVDQPECAHVKGGRTIGIFGDKARDTAAEKRHYSKPKETRGGPPKDILFSLEQALAAMGIDWMNFKELSQAIPPAYTEYISEFLLRYINNDRI